MKITIDCLDEERASLAFDVSVLPRVGESVVFEDDGVGYRVSHVVHRVYSGEIIVGVER